MKSRFQWISVFTAVLVISSLQNASNAQMPKSFSMATVMSKAQIAKIGDQVGQAFDKAMDADGKTSVSFSKLGTEVMKSAKDRFACSKGGYIDTTYTFRWIETTDTGTATMSVSARQTLSNWRCISGWVVNGNPYISHTVNGSVFAGKTTVRGTISGGWKAISSNKAKQSCRISGSAQWSTLGDSGVGSSTMGDSGVGTTRINCVPGGAISITTRF